MKKDLQTAFSSRQYMVSKDFEIYYYNDAHFSGVKSHTHTYYEFYLFLEGDVAMLIDGTSVSLRSGDVLLIPPGVPHHAVSPRPDMPYRRFVFWVSAQYFEHLVSLSDSYRYVLGKAARGKCCLFRCDRMELHVLQGKVFQLIEELHSDRFGKDIKLHLCANDLILQINRMAYEQDHPDTPSASMDLYENILQYIEDHLEEELTLDYLAGAFYVSKFHIAHIFKENLGISVHQYILKKRLAMCRDAILGSTSITEAYLLYGFKDYSAFFRAFRKEYGLSPKEYRELYAPSAPKR